MENIIQCTLYHIFYTVRYYCTLILYLYIFIFILCLYVYFCTQYSIYSYVRSLKYYSEKVVDKHKLNNLYLRFALRTVTDDRFGDIISWHMYVCMYFGT